MAIKKDITFKRVDGSYFKPVGITFDRGGMMTIYGDVWKDAADREANQNEPVLSRIAFFTTDDKAKEAAVKIMYEFAEFFPELAGGEAIYEDRTKKESVK
jgi:hypothetical protein